MNQRIPLDFPKVWPYNQEYRDHITKALSVRQSVSTLLEVGLLFIFLGLIGMFLFGFIELFIPARISGCLLLMGIVLSVTGNKVHKNKLKKVINEAKKQVSVEALFLRSKASGGMDFWEAEDTTDLAVMESSNTSHYTPNWAWVRKKLLERDESRCCFCGRTVHLADSVAHHISAFSEGGKTVFSNLVTICVECHSIIHPWLNPNLNIFWIRYERGRVYCWKCKSRLDTSKTKVTICSDCGWLHHITDGACGCNYPGR